MSTPNNDGQSLINTCGHDVQLLIAERLTTFEDNLSLYLATGNADILKQLTEFETDLGTKNGQNLIVNLLSMCPNVKELVLRHSYDNSIRELLSDYPEEDVKELMTKIARINQNLIAIRIDPINSRFKFMVQRYYSEEVFKINPNSLIGNPIRWYNPKYPDGVPFDPISLNLTTIPIDTVMESVERLMIQFPVAETMEMINSFLPNVSSVCLRNIRQGTVEEFQQLFNMEQLDCIALIIKSKRTALNAIKALETCNRDDLEFVQIEFRDRERNWKTVLEYEDGTLVITALLPISIVDVITKFDQVEKVDLEIERENPVQDRNIQEVKRQVDEIRNNRSLEFEETIVDSLVQIEPDFFWVFDHDVQRMNYEETVNNN